MVNRRWVTTAAVASSGGTPKAVRPAISAASWMPMPPGTGVRLARRGRCVHEHDLHEGQAAPVREHATREADAVEQLRGEAPAEHEHELARRREDAPEVPQRGHDLRPDLVPHRAAQLRDREHDAHQHRADRHHREDEPAVVAVGAGDVAEADLLADDEARRR